jgi:hypothetical protein
MMNDESGHPALLALAPHQEGLEAGLEVPWFRGI